MLVLALALYWLFVAAPAAEAYFDLSTGAYLVQMIFGFLAAFWLSFRNTLFKKKPKVKENKEETVDEKGAGHAES